jgi:hypothetical protein
MFIFLAALGVARGGLVFPEKLKEVHAPPDAHLVTVDSPFVNQGDKPGTIKKYDAAGSCIGAKIKGGKLTYEPGEKGVIRTTFSLGNFSGVIDKSLQLWVEGDPKDKPSIVLTVRVHIPELVKIVPKTLKWTVGEDPVPKSLDITMNFDKPIKILGVTGSNENFTQKLETIEEGKKYRIVVTPSDTGTPGIGILRIETDCPIARHRIRQAFLVVRRNFGKSK